MEEPFHFFALSPDLLCTLGFDGFFKDVNPAWQTALGYTRAHLLATPFIDLVHVDDRAATLAKAEEIAQGQTVTAFENRYRCQDGSYRWLHWNAAPVAALELMYAIARDVTDQKNVDAALVQKNLELEKASRLKSDFLANMSHELRTPLNAIIGFSEVLRDGLVGELTPRQRGFISDIYGSGQHLLALINDILDLSKVEAGKMVLELEAIAVSALLSTSMSIIREKAASRRIALVTEAAEDLGHVMVDPRKVKQIVYNLLANAVKFTGDGGRVTLRVSLVALADVARLSGRWPGRSQQLLNSECLEFLQISVTDSGIGIAPDQLLQLFVPFSQIESGLARRFEGTGLGLAMVKMLAELHGGTVAVESAVDEGSCFSVWLPIRPCSQPQVPEAPGTDAPDAAVDTRTALVIESDPQAALLIRAHLEAEGFAVVYAASGEAALAVAQQYPVSLITLDILLPHMDGWDFLSRIKQMPGLNHVPIVIMSMTVDQRKGFALGAAAVMHKPVSRQDLHDALVSLGLYPLTDGTPLTVLVVDDDPVAVDLLAVRIGGMGATAICAYGGRQAIEFARLHTPQLIVLDLLMPDVDGFDVIKALKDRAATAEIPILVVTAKDLAPHERATLNATVAGIIEKAAFDPDEFIAEVRRALGTRRGSN